MTRLLAWLIDSRLAANLKWLVSSGPHEEFPPKPENRSGFSGPVNWLLGRQLISGLNRIALYIAYRDKLDLRDWMEAKELVWPTMSGGDEFWFDYLADTGDGQMAAYSLAYLCMRDVRVKGSTSNPPTIGTIVELNTDSRNLVTLPRGEFLFVGGDTGYHVADYATLAYQFQLPFHWAFQDLCKEGKLANRGRYGLFGIPGNHDYYDQLDGFNRQFRHPANPENEPTRRQAIETGRKPLLTLPTFERFQEASYFALRLPFDWWLWGLDTENGELDFRQREFFKRANGGNIPDKLIVATPEPTTVWSRYATGESNSSKPFRGLELETPFLRDAPDLGKGKCRLDLSGDIHQYARYWGSAVPNKSAPAKKSYASVVSGLGGAFLHPPREGLNEIEEQVLYPPPGKARKEVAKKIFNPLFLMWGGYLWLFGATCSIIVYFASVVPSSSRTITDFVLRRVFGISQELLIRPAGWFSAEIEINLSWGSQFNVQPFVHSIFILLSFLLSAAAITASIKRANQLDKAVYKRQVTTWDYWPNFVFLSIAVTAPCFAILRFGDYRAANVVSDLAFMFVIGVLILGFLGLALGVGSKMEKVAGKGLFAALGTITGFLQLIVPLLLMRLATWRAGAVIPFVILVFSYLGYRLTASNRRILLIASWLLYGATLIYLPIKLSDATARLPVGWLKVPFLLVAGMIGAIMICVWLGWYFAIAFVFNGHHEEAGGAARIEKFKQFIRFRLMPDGLTGFVIGINEPAVNGSQLTPKLIDVFHLEVAKV